MSAEEHIFFFVLFGIVGIFLEVCFITLTNLFKKKKDRTLAGQSSFWMFFIYGTVYFIILFGRTFFPELHLLVRALIYIPLFYLLEFCSGSLLKKFKAIPWDYCRKKRKFHINGIICLDFAPLWYIGGVLFDLIYSYIQSHMIL